MPQELPFLTVLSQGLHCWAVEGARWGDPTAALQAQKAAGRQRGAMLGWVNVINVKTPSMTILTLADNSNLLLQIR